MVVWEYIVNLNEPILLLITLQAVFGIVGWRRVAALLSIVAFGAITAIMRLCGLPYEWTLTVNLVAYLAFCVLLYRKEKRSWLIYALSAGFMVSNLALSYAITLLPAVSAAETTVSVFVRFTMTSFFVMINVLFTVTLITIGKGTPRKFPTWIYCGVLVLCILGVLSLYLLVDVALATEAARGSSATCAVISGMLVALLLAILGLFGMIVNEMQKRIEFQAEANALKLEGAHNMELIGVAQSVRQIRHDYTSHLDVIGTLVKRGEYDELTHYMHDYHAEYGVTSCFVLTGNTTLDALLTSKLLLCEREAIRTSVSVSGLEELPLNSIETTSLFGNLFDNSINACRLLPENKRYITLTVKQRAQMLDINIKNSAIDDYLSPAEGHGLGLPRIRKIVDVYNGVCLIEHAEGVFEVDILLPISERKIK